MKMSEKEYLEHFGVRGMKWGVRKESNRDARTQRLNDGTATIRDKVIRDADLDGGRTQKIKKGEIKPMSKQEKRGVLIAAAVLGISGGLKLTSIILDARKEHAFINNIGPYPSLPR